MTTTLTASTQNGCVELRQNGSTWQVLVKPAGSGRFIHVSTGSLTTGPDTVTVHKLRLDKSNQLATLAGKPLKLTPTEFAVLSVLMAEPTRKFGLGAFPGDRSTIYKLKAKLGPGYIFNCPRVGWSLLP